MVKIKSFTPLLLLLLLTFSCSAKEERNVEISWDEVAQPGHDVHGVAVTDTNVVVLGETSSESLAIWQGEDFASLAEEPTKILDDSLPTYLGSRLLSSSSGFIAFSDSQAWQSADGTEWDLIESPEEGFVWQDAVASQDSTTVVGSTEDMQQIWELNADNSWELLNEFEGSNSSSLLAYGSPGYVLVTYDLETFESEIKTSTDGKEWKAAEEDPSNAGLISSITWDPKNNQFLSIGFSLDSEAEAVVAASTNGLSWEKKDISAFIRDGESITDTDLVSISATEEGTIFISGTTGGPPRSTTGEALTPTVWFSQDTDDWQATTHTPGQSSSANVWRTFVGPNGTCGLYGSNNGFAGPENGEGSIWLTPC